MKIILDVMGGDNPPSEIIKGAVLARRELGSSLILAGNETLIRETLASLGEDADNYGIAHSDGIITMEDSPMSIVQKKKDSSMAKALSLLADGEGDAVVSCGNTGALFTGATLLVRRIRGVRRAALGTILPYTNNVMLMDCGANVTVTAEYLLQFAHLGSIYMQKLYGIPRPRVALINNGSEDHKGTPLIIEARALLEADENINFIGNVEGKDLPFDCCDVAVCDGFTGNVILKTSEGLCRYLMEYVTRETAGAPAGVVEKIARTSRHFDVTEYGGTPFVGIAKPVIKAHGDSEANAIRNALMCAEEYAKSDVIDGIEKAAEIFNPPAALKAGGVK